MHGHRRPSTVILAAICCLILSIPLLVGQGCPTGSEVIPITGRLPGDTNDGGGGTNSPTFRFTSPLGNVDAEVGDNIVITWSDKDPDSNATIAILLDPDDNPNNGNEIPVQTNISEDDPANSLTISTGGLGLLPGTYKIIARVTDGVNPELVVTAGGSIVLYPVGAGPVNVSPSISVSQPKTNMSVSQNDQVAINYCGNDPDGGTGNLVADVIIMLDENTNSLDDLYSGLDLSSSDATVAIRDICNGKLPAVINGGIVLSCTKDNKCTNPIPGTTYNLKIDTTKIPQTSDGSPYHVRVDMWDHTNPPVSRYAPGTLSVATVANGTLDLKTVGRQVAGTKFIGFDTGAQAGSTGTPVGDFDGDGADDFIIVSRFGRPYERGNVGSAHMVYGTKGQRFGAEIYLNSFGTEYRGCEFAGGRGRVAGYWIVNVDMYAQAAYRSDKPVTEGIVNVSTIEDMNGDGKPELFFGLPYVEEMYDYFDDDPCDKENLCYNDGLPNPLSTDKQGSNNATNDDIGAFDSRSDYYTQNNVTYLCSNSSETTSTPINQGYMIYVSSTNTMEDTVIDLPLVGQKDPASLLLEDVYTMVPGSSAPDGVRLRGAYYTGTFSDETQGFGRTLGSMPDLGNGGTVPRKDGYPEFLVSMPGAFSKLGAVMIMWGRDISSFCEQPVQSIPDIRKIGDCGRAQYIPDYRIIYGRKAGDELGYASRAGDFNRDGHQDILCGAPGSSYGTAEQAGTIYIIFGRLDFGLVDLSKTGDPTNPARQYVPRLEIQATHAGDRFGEVQTLLGDINNDGFSDVAIASQRADGLGGIDCGYVGIIFGGRQLTGENTFSIDQIGTSQLPGVVFYGSQQGGHAGATIADAGDFNHDGFNDLLISAPDEYRTINQQSRHGVAYLVFGGPHLYNNIYLLSEVGTAALPGIVFVSPYATATADEATIDWVGSAGDVDADGFDDVLVGISLADFVNPLEPGQRRVDAGEAYLIYGNNAATNVIR